MISVSIAAPQDAGEIGLIAYQTGILHSNALPDEFLPTSQENQTAYIRDSITGDSATVFKAELDGKIAGYVVLYIDEMPEKYFVHAKKGFIGSIGVEENCRGKGVASAMISHVESFLKEKGIGVLDIDVYVFNQRAEKLYDKLGFQELKHYKRKRLS